jgi:hypothetical protein
MLFFLALLILIALAVLYFRMKNQHEPPKPQPIQSMAKPPEKNPSRKREFVDQMEFEPQE